MSLLSISTAGFTPGDPPLNASDVAVVADIGSFVLGQGFAESNPYALAVGPDDDLFIADAAANAIIRIDQQTGSLSVFATFGDLPNPTPIGPPMIDPVPTGIVFTGNQFYVGSLTGFPFPDGAARIYEVDTDGNVSVFRDNLTTIVDLAIDPRDGELVALQFAQFTPPPPPGFQPGTGQVIKFDAGSTETLADGLNLTPGLHFGAAGNLFVSSLFGQILKVDLTPPVCAEITFEFNQDGIPDAVVSGASDPESGIDEIAFSRLVNLDGFYDSGSGRTNGFEEGDVVDLDEASVPSVEFGGNRTDFTTNRAVLQVEVTNGAGLTATCDPVLETLSAQVPEGFALRGNYPNPFARQTTIEFQVAEAAEVTLEVYDMLGRKVTTLIDGEQMAARTYRLRWDGRGQSGAPLSSGVYVYRLEAGSFTATRKMTLVR